MGLNELKPGNTKRVKCEQIEFDYVKRCIEQDTTGKCFVSVLDMFEMYLAFNAGEKGKTLARNTVMQYCRQCKIWLFELFPVQRHIVEAKLLSMGTTFDNFCMKRDEKVVNKVPPCSKSDLKKMMSYLYKNASSSSDYHDTALLCLLWYLFGRASDLSLVRKQNLSVDAAEVFFVRFIRVKTSEEQGLSLFPDADFTTCPPHVIATALITQTALSVALIDNLPEIPAKAAVTLTPAIPLVEVLNGPDEFAALAAIEAPKPVAGTPKPIASAPTVYFHSNRLLERVAPPAGVGFNYIFNTSMNDHWVSRALSGDGTEAEVKAMNLKAFDAETISDSPLVCETMASCFRPDQDVYNLQVTERDPKSFEPKEWLNDSVISYFIREFIHAHGSTDNFDGQLFDSIFMAYKTNKRNMAKTHEAVRGITATFPYAKYTTILIPVCMDAHWSFVILQNPVLAIDGLTPAMLHVDSLQYHYTGKIERALCGYFRKEALQKYNIKKITYKVNVTTPTHAKQTVTTVESSCCTSCAKSRRQSYVPKVSGSFRFRLLTFAESLKRIEPISKAAHIGWVT
ncbi:unnamed protein product [Phytophthora fragariaefolia]|uniref:Unnamed protein product n=1 Tax=Phytophthora fragariaefolia TaxID=1490495 RepID=A0A9W7CP94_9STRA|nr:unnamed protein product [Phytophthora fragariaefolia]